MRHHFAEPAFGAGCGLAVTPIIVIGVALRCRDNRYHCDTGYRGGFPMLARKTESFRFSRTRCISPAPSTRLRARRLVMPQRRQRLAHRRRPQLVADRRHGPDARRFPAGGRKPNLFVFRPAEKRVRRGPILRTLCG